MAPTPQAGILNRPPEHALFLALSFQQPITDASAGIEKLRTLIQEELSSNLADTTPKSPKDQPSAETGELGFDDGYDRYHLTITVGFGKSAYDALAVATADQPQDLIPIPWDKLADQTPDGARTVDQPANGDLLLQICSNSVYINEHVSRRVEHELAADFTVAWAHQGAQRHTSRDGHINVREGRALIGFLDGTSNLDPRNADADNVLVFVDPANIADYPPQTPPAGPQPNPYDNGPTPPNFPPDLRVPPTREPDWTKDGTYLTIRVSVLSIPDWDGHTLGDQEHVIGRWKVSGSALDAPNDPTQAPAEPNFGNDPTGATTPFTAHIRKANPRGPGDDKRRIFRRGYPLVVATTKGIERGLIFAGFGRTLTTQFEFITRAWTTNVDFPAPGAGIDQLRQFEHVLSGGYFFVPPLQHAHQPWSWVVPAAGAVNT